MGSRVKSPRHFLVFEVADTETILVLRFIHDRCEIRRLLQEESED